jgi:hypothetical protein
VFAGPTVTALLAVATFCLLVGCANNWTPNRAAAPPYGIASLTNRATVTDKDGTRRTCETVASGGIELTTPQVKAVDGCGSRIDAGAGSVAAFGGQGYGAAIYAAKVQADLQRDLALIQAGKQIGAAGACAGLLASGAGAALPAEAVASCLQALTSIGGGQMPLPAPKPLTILPPRRPAAFAPALYMAPWIDADGVAHSADDDGEYQ